MLKHIQVEIRRNEQTTIAGSYPAWELPLLQAVHGHDSVVIKGDKLVDRQPPEAADEFKRLEDRYKRSREDDGSYGPSFVSMVYGQLGVAKLNDAIKAAVTSAPQNSLVGDDDSNSSVGG